MADQSVRDLKLIQYLNEAYGKEKELETALQAHISMTTKKPLKKRLQDHLRETKSHARQVQQRIKQLGGKAEAVPVPAPGPIGDAASAVTSVANKAVSAAKGPLHALRGTGEHEKMLKNAKTAFSDEHEEIATYHAIETLAETVGDKDTAKLARAIRREEERMAKFLAGQITSLTKGVAREEIPAAERRNGGSPRRRSASSRRSRSTSSRSNGSRARASKSTASKSRTARAGGSSKSSGARSKSSGSKSGGSRSTRARASSSGSRSRASSSGSRSTPARSGSRSTSARSGSRSSGAKSSSSRASGSRARSGSRSRS